MVSFPPLISVSVKIATAQEKTFYILHIEKCESMITVQCDFHLQNSVKSGGTTQSIWHQHKQFQDTGCLCKEKCTDCLCISHEDVCTSSIVICNSQKSTCVSWELAGPHKTVGVFCSTVCYSNPTGFNYYRPSV